MRPRGIYGAVQRDFFFFLTSKSKIVEEVKVKPGRGFLKDALSRRKMHFFFANALRCRHFPNFHRDIFLKTQRHLNVVIIFKVACKRTQQCWELSRACWQWCANGCNNFKLCGFKLCATTRNNIQQHETGCANRRNM